MRPDETATSILMPTNGTFALNLPNGNATAEDQPRRDRRRKTITPHRIYGPAKAIRCHRHGGNGRIGR